MLRPFYDWTLRVSGHRHAERWLALVSFVESSVFPIPPDVMMVPMILADRSKAWRIAAIATVASVLGGLLGYAIGALFFEAIGQPILELYGKADKFEAFAEMYNTWGAWVVFGAGVTPFPYKVITIASGVTRLDLLIFIRHDCEGRDQVLVKVFKLVVTPHDNDVWLELINRLAGLCEMLS